MNYCLPNWEKSTQREIMSSIPVYNFFGSLMKYFGPLKLLDFWEQPGIPKLNKVARIDFRLHELFRMVGRTELGKAQAKICWKSLNFSLFLYFCLYSVFTIVRTFQYMMCTEGTVAMTAVNFVWIVTVAFAYIPYHAFVSRKRDTEQLLISWNMLEQELLPGNESLWTPSPIQLFLANA